MLGLFVAILGLGYGVDQSDFALIAPLFALGFGAYTWINLRRPTTDLRWWIGIAILLRLALIPSFPALSDDIYRFIWDGRLWLAGRNPFDHLPTYYLEAGQQLPTLTEALFSELNSPEYYTIYPPVAQFTFVVASWLAPESWWGAAVVMKVFVVAAEIGSIFLLLRLLQHWQLDQRLVLWYALNPLIIVEVCGNLHFEGVMIFFLLLGWWWLTQERWWASAVAMALAVASKLLPLMFFPFLIRRLGWRRALGYFAVVGTVLLATWIPLVSSAFLENFASSVNLYFQRFEFNGSLYYALRWLGYQYSGHNLIRLIGPILALIVLVTISLRALLDRRNDWVSLANLWLFAIGLYLLCATTIHPWYTALPVVLCLFTPYRWPVLWSGLITLTYVNYIYAEYQENLWIVLLEYILVGTFLVWEWSKHRLRPAPSDV
ncbi:MAG: glycosyltransferase family 87 protein [Bacteroidota bacterium]